MTTKKITKRLLAAGGVMLVSSCIPIQSGFAVDGSLPAFLTQSATTLDVTVSDRAYFNILGGGSNDATVSGIQVTNNLHSAPILVSGIQASAAEGYSLESYDADFSAFAIDSGHFAIAYTGEQSDGEDISGDGLAIEDEIAATAQKEFTFAGKSSSYSTTIAAEDNAHIANITLTVGLKEAQASDPEPDEPFLGAVLDTGRNVNNKLKILSGTLESPNQVFGDEEIFDTCGVEVYDEEWGEYYTDTSACPSVNVKYDYKITAISRSDTLPSGFTPEEKNIISTAASEYPIYAWYDSGNIYYYTEAEKVSLNTDMSHTFHGLPKLSSIPSAVSDWDTSNVTDMSGMFQWVGGITIDLTGWDTSNVTDMSSMFAYAAAAGSTNTGMTILGLSNLNTSQVVNMSHMFDSMAYDGLTEFDWDLTAWDTSSAADMSYMFASVRYSNNAPQRVDYPISIDLSGWNTSKVTDMSSMFYNAGGYHYVYSFALNLSGWDTSKVTTMNQMFDGAGSYAKTAWSIVGLSNWDVSSVTDMYMMFRGAGSSAPVSLDLSNWSLSENVNASMMLDNIGKASVSLNLSHWDTSKVQNLFLLFGSTTQATNWTAIIPATNGNGISNTTSKMYGNSTSVSTTPPNGKSFTIAQ